MNQLGQPSTTSGLLTSTMRTPFSLAVEQAPALESQGTVSVVQQIGPELWAIGDSDGLAIGVVEASGTVAFCHREG